MRQNSVALFIPAYNCEAQLRRVLDALTPAHLKVFRSVFIVDNVSRDQTLAVAREWAGQQSGSVHVLQNEVNLGLGGSHKRIFQRCRDEGISHVVVLHGDDQATLDDFSELLSARETWGPEHIFGSRFSLRSRRVGYSRVKTIGNYFFCIVSSVISRRVISDFGGSGLNVYSVEALSSGRISKKFADFPNDLTFHPFVLLAGLLDGIPMRFVPISWREEDQTSTVRAWRQGTFLLKLLGRFWLTGPEALFQKQLR